MDAEHVTGLLERCACLTRERLAGGRRWSPVLYLYAGPDSGAALAAIRANVPEDAFLLYVIVGEAARTPEALAVTRPETELVLVTRDDDELGVTVALTLSALMSQKVIYAVHDAVKALDAGYLERLKGLSDTALLDAAQNREGRLINFRCAVHNLPSILRDRGTEFWLTPGTPAVICGAGPSVMGDLPLLRTYRDRVLIISMSRFAPILIEQGIAPDFVVHVDQEMGLNDWSVGLGNNMTLVAVASASPTATARFSEAVWASADSFWFNRAMENMGVYLTPLCFARTGLVAAIDYARHLRCRHIALIGSDLCLSAEGRTHPERYLSEDFFRNDVFTVPGYDGETERTTSDLNVLRLGIEDYLRRLKAKAAKVGVFNCSARGAVLNGAGRMSFKAFLETYAGDRKVLKKVHVKRPSPPFDFEAVRTAARDCRDTLARAAETGEDLSDREDAFFFRDWLKPILDHADQVLFDRPGKSPTLTSWEKEKHALAAETIGDFLDDFDWVADRIAGREPSISPPPSPIVFKSFRRRGVALVRASNPELADALEARAFPTAEEHFSFFANWTQPPFLSLRRENGAAIPLSDSFKRMDRTVRRENFLFAREKKFDVTRDAIIFFAPGNWLHPTEWVKVYPDTAMMIVDPWPDCLSWLLDHCDLARFFSADTVIVAMDDRLTKWQRVYHARVRQWLREGRRVLFFPHPITWDLPEVRAARERLPDAPAS